MKICSHFKIIIYMKRVLELKEVGGRLRRLLEAG
jgi:hypothetical protein